jgi:hypothetical protein
MMDEPEITCELVDERDLDTRYLAGRLSEPEAAAFEAHYFACDRCWALVRGGVGVRAARSDVGAGSDAARDLRLPTRHRTWWQPVAIAAGIGLVALGTWRVVDSRRGPRPDVMRGREDSLPLSSVLEESGWRAAWPAVAGTSFYRIRVFTPDGRLQLEREVSETTFVWSADSVAGLGDGTRYVEVQAIDPLRRPIARSPLTPLRAPADSG